MARDPAECSLHHPSLGHPAPPTSARCAFHHFEIPFSRDFTPLSQLLPSISRVCPDFGEAWHKVFESSQQTACPSGVMHSSLGDINRERNAERVHEEMTLAPFDALVSIKPADPGGL